MTEEKQTKRRGRPPGAKDRAPPQIPGLQENRQDPQPGEGQELCRCRDPSALLADHCNCGGPERGPQ